MMTDKPEHPAVTRDARPFRDALPQRRPVGLLSETPRQVLAGGRKIVVLNDDPTGSQTVHGCLLLTQWDVGPLEEGFADASLLFFVLATPVACPRPKPGGGDAGHL